MQRILPARWELREKRGDTRASGISVRKLLRWNEYPLARSNRVQPTKEIGTESIHSEGKVWREEKGNFERKRRIHFDRS